MYIVKFTLDLASDLIKIFIKLQWAEEDKLTSSISHPGQRQTTLSNKRAWRRKRMKAIRSLLNPSLILTMNQNLGLSRLISPLMLLKRRSKR